MRSAEKFRAWARARCANTFARRGAESHGFFRRARQSLRLAGRDQPTRAHIRLDLRRRANPRRTDAPPSAATAPPARPWPELRRKAPASPAGRRPRRRRDRRRRGRRPSIAGPPVRPSPPPRRRKTRSRFVFLGQPDEPGLLPALAKNPLALSCAAAARNIFCRSAGRSTRRSVFMRLTPRASRSRRPRPIRPRWGRSAANRRRASRETAGASSGRACSPRVHRGARKNHHRIGVQRQQFWPRSYSATSGTRSFRAAKNAALHARRRPRTWISSTPSRITSRPAAGD